MIKFLLLVDIAVDSSGGEYGFTFVDNVYLGCEEFESDEEALKKAKELSIEQHQVNTDWVKYESVVRIKRI